MAYKILWLVVLLGQIAFVAYFIYRSRKTKIEISKSTVIWFLPVYIFNLVLYTFGFKAGTSDADNITILNSAAAALRLFAFEIRFDHLKGVINVDVLFSIAFYTSYVLSVFTIVGTAIILTKNFIRNFFQVNKTLKNSADIVIGFNSSAIEYYNNNPKETVIWISSQAKKAEIEYLYDNKIPFIKADVKAKNISKYLTKKFGKDEKKYNFIAFDYEKNNYQSLVDEFVLFNKTSNSIVFLFLEVEHEESEIVREEYLKYQEVIKKDQKAFPEKVVKHHLFVRTFSRYELITTKFIEKNTIPSLLPNSFYNENRTIKDEKEINVFFLGFGKVNASMFKLFCQNNQLVTEKDNELKAKLINYYIVDKNKDAANDKRIEYIMQSSLDFESDFPLPEKMANFTKFNTHVNGCEIINKIKEKLDDKNAYNLIIVSYGNDYENMETALWLYNQFNQPNLKIACRVKEARVEDDKIIYFGNEKEIISKEYIVDEKLQTIAKAIDAEYNKLTFVQGKKTDISFEMHWAKLNQIELYSNIYSAINLRFKFNLLGLDLTKDPNVLGLTIEEFMEIYNPNKDNHKTDYFATTRRNVVAYSEKLRWNAFYLFNGYRPMREKDLKIVESKKINDKGKEVITYSVHRKDTVLKEHVFVTSHKGIKDVQDYIKENLLNEKEEYKNINNDYYKYDYMVLDSEQSIILRILMDNGYKIIPLEKK